MPDEVTQEEADAEAVETPAGPWAKDLEASFDDPDVRARVDEFLRQTVQPRVTQLEQTTKPNRDALKLWDAFQENPVQTYVQVAAELFGEDEAARIARIAQGEQEAEPPAAAAPEQEWSDDGNEPPSEGDGPLSLDKLPPEVREMVASKQAEEQRNQYYKLLDQLREDHADELPKDAKGEPVLDIDVFHPFVVSAGGDFEAAFQGYLNWSEKAGVQSTPSEEEAEAHTEAPPAIDSTTRAAPGAVPPQEKQFGSLDEAMDSFFDEQQSPPPTVGEV